MNRFVALSWIAVALLVPATGAYAQAAPAQAAPRAGASPVTVEVEDDVEITATPASTPAAAPATPPTAAVTPAPVAPAPVAPAPVAAAPAAPVAQASTTQSDSAAFAARLAQLEQQNTELQGRLKSVEDRSATQAEAIKPWLGLKLSGFVQAQLEGNQLSEDELSQNGGSLNKNRFLVRRGRVRVDRTWQYAALAVELDAAAGARGLTVTPRRAEATLRWSNPSADAPPYLQATAGLQDIPFGYELPYGSKNRIFAERSLASTAFFPAEPDVGASISGGYGPARYAVAVMNGQPSENGSVALSDQNAATDVIGRIGVEAKPQDWLTIAGGVSFLNGTGFHGGSVATKNRLEWIDQNEDRLVSANEITARPGTSAERSRNFDRWAVGADAELGLRTTLGWSRLYVVLTLATNLDRGLFVADPYSLSDESNTRELGYYIAFTQEVTRYGLLGFRTDFYDGNSDFTDTRRGKIVPADQSVRTFSPLIGLVLPERARLVFQYDFIDDSFARDKRGVPTDLGNNQWTLRLQVGI